MTVINWLSQNIDSRFETLHKSLTDLKQAMADVEKRVTSNESGLTSTRPESKLHGLSWEGMTPVGLDY